ncbi:MAG: carbohydrate kinase [Selenomonadaceae bacterium]|nr:carbohydrate kinase [Selenomonadaceae bacterium]
MEELLYIAKHMKGKKILVIGDIVADVYLDGHISRISREAPVLILDKVGEKVVAGGAANVAANAATLGAEVYVIGVIGDDKYADELKKKFKELGIHVEGLVRDKSRPTISKTRVIAGGRATVSQQIVRIDSECKEPLSKKVEVEILTKIDKILPQVEGIILSDYGSGTITSDVRTLIKVFAPKNKIPTMVDSRYNIGEFEGIDYIKQNDAELAAYAGYPLNNVSDLIEASTKLLTKLNANGALITRGEQGMSLFERDGSTHHIPVANVTEVYDVSGAGDTCVAAFIIALTSGAQPSVAARISNLAAGIAVRKLGTATVSIAELISAIQSLR